MDKKIEENPYKRNWEILVIDDEQDALDACTQILTSAGYSVATSLTSSEALRKLKDRPADLVIADLKLPGMDGIELLKNIKQIDPQAMVIMITGYATIPTAIESMKLGAFDYIPKPFGADELLLAVSRAVERRALVLENRELKERIQSEIKTPEIAGESEGIKAVFSFIDKVAKTNATVLIYGETGTGKELVAKQIHAQSGRSAKSMVIINCSAIPGTLMESELFGYARGAFTGALKQKKGRFELAHNSTLFLDEIGDISLDLQAKLLRTIEDQEIVPVGSESKIKVDVRIIAATNKDLRAAIGGGYFREDLFYRLNVMPIHLPPLRERGQDIVILADYFLKKYSDELNKKVKGFTDKAMELFQNYGWPGNVREMENAIERALILTDGDVLTPDDFSHLLDHAVKKEAGVSAAQIGPHSGLKSLEDIEHDYILKVLEETRWNKKKASEILGISLSTLWRKLDKK